MSTLPKVNGLYVDYAGGRKIAITFSLDAMDHTLRALAESEVGHAVANPLIDIKPSGQNSDIKLIFNSIEEAQKVVNRLFDDKRFADEVSVAGPAAVGIHNPAAR